MWPDIDLDKVSEVGAAISCHGAARGRVPRSVDKRHRRASQQIDSQFLLVPVALDLLSSKLVSLLVDPSVTVLEDHTGCDTDESDGHRGVVSGRILRRFAIQVQERSAKTSKTSGSDLHKRDSFISFEVMRLRGPSRDEPEERWR